MKTDTYEEDSYEYSNHFAGGSGVRMGAGMPKQFLEINGKPIIIHTLDNFQNSPSIDKIYISCKKTISRHYKI